MATFALLLAGGIVCLLFAMRLTAVAFDCTFSPFRYLYPQLSHPAIAVLLAAVLCLLVVAVWLVVREDEDRLWLSAESGGILVPSADLQRVATQTALRHPDVVGAEARLRLRGGAPAGTMNVTCRPLADAAAVAAAVAADARDELAAVVGRPAGDLRVRARVLTVKQLKRHLP